MYRRDEATSDEAKKYTKRSVVHFDARAELEVFIKHCAEWERNGLAMTTSVRTRYDYTQQNSLGERYMMSAHCLQYRSSQVPSYQNGYLEAENGCRLSYVSRNFNI